MNKIERNNNNWYYVDRLDGVDLQDGELLEIVFPDGETTLAIITVEASYNTVKDIDHSSRYLTTSIAFITTDYHGILLKVPLVGLEARRLEEPKPKELPPQLRIG